MREPFVFASMRFMSSPKQKVSTGTAWESRCGCARAVRIGDTIHVSGTCAQGDTATAQVEAIFSVIDNAIRKAGGRGLEDVVITRMIAADVQKDFQELGDAHRAVFSKALVPTQPSNTLFGGTLLLPWMKVEIEATAVVQERSGKRVVLVTGATGRIGKEVVARLAKAGGFHVRVALHSPGKAGYLKDLGANELVKFDYTDPSTWAPALKDVEVVYSASLDPLLEHHLKFCDFLGTRKSQIRQVVRISCMGADTNTACYKKDVHVSRKGAEIPLMLQHYWWGEE